MRRTRVASGNDLLSSVPRLEKISIVPTRIVLRVAANGVAIPVPLFRPEETKEKRKKRKEEKSHRYPSALNQRQPVAILQKIIGGEET